MDTMDAKTSLLHMASSWESAQRAPVIDHHAQLLRYYEGAGPDYEAWSHHFNMHFGYWRPGINPLRREQMLEETSHQVFHHLVDPSSSTAQIVDLGCGLGASMRTGARRFPNHRFTGITVVPWQIARGRELTVQEGLAHQVEFHEADYCHVPLPNASIDGCYAIESAVHGEGADKRPLIREAYRLLRRGRRLVIFDCFLHHPPDQMHTLVRWCYQRACLGWAVKEMAQIHAFRQTLAEEGFRNISHRDISWRVAPSVGHVPWVTAKFLVHKLLRREVLGPVSWRHVQSCLLACALGLARRSLGYFLVRAEK